MTAALLARLNPATWPRTPRPTARFRLTLLYGTLFLVSGAVLLAVTYLLAAHATAAVDRPKAEPFGSKPPTPAGAPRTAHPTSGHQIHLTPSRVRTCKHNSCTCTTSRCTRCCCGPG